MVPAKTLSVLFLGLTIGLLLGATSVSFYVQSLSDAHSKNNGHASSDAKLIRGIQSLVGTPDPPAQDSNFRSFKANANLFARLAHLERKVNGGLNWLKNPHFHDTNTYRCKNRTNFSPDGQGHGFYDHWVCLDNIDLKKGCVVYDFGIRQQPHFGEALARDFGCEVHAFDPSPITLSWITTAPVSKLPNYHFHPWGGGGVDGKTSLYEYWDWDQISIIKMPTQLLNEYTDDGKGRDKVNWSPAQKELQITVKTIPTIMKELGHDFVDILKVDVEGSEFLMFQDLFDQTDCPPVDQVTMEWHHFDLDMRYGSSPHVNSIVSMLHECGLHQFEHSDPYLREDANSKHQFRYSESSYCKRCHEATN